MISGAALFARYAYPPNALGYCGPDDSGALLEYAAAGSGGRGLVELARRFDGAWPYLSLIAGATGRDPLDAAVVRAYWIGSRLLERVPARLLAAQLDERFARRLGVGRADLTGLALAGGRAHHNFHVLAVYPWVGMLRAGLSVRPLRVLDSCRVAWGSVTSVSGAMATVDVRPLVWTERAVVLGAPRPRVARVASDGYTLAAHVQVGDVVSLHWDWVCEVLDPGQVAALRRYTAGQLRLVNSAAPRLGPSCLPCGVLRP